MRHLRFGRTDATVSAVAVGTWPHGGPILAGDRPVGWSGHDDGLARAALVRAWELGLNHWDTADVYGDGRAEELIGSVFDTVRRDEIFLATKVGWHPGPNGEFYEPAHMRQRLERSLRLLKTDCVDLLYLHHCDFGTDDERLEPALEAVHDFRSEGKVRFIGLSDWDPAKVVKLAPVVNPDAIQPYRNVLDDRWESSGLAAWAAANDVGVAFFSPLRHGLLLGRSTEPRTFSSGDFRSTVEGFTDRDLLARLAANRGVLEIRFGEHEEPVLHALLGALLSGCKAASTLVGLRNPSQVEAASRAGQALAPDVARWVADLYRDD